jgi:INO80 complex subunit C
MSSRDPRRVDTSTNAARKRQNAAHVMACPIQAPFTRSCPQTTPITIHLQTSNKQTKLKPTMAPAAPDADAHQQLIDQLDIHSIHKPFRNHHWKPNQRRNKNIKTILGDAVRKEASLMPTQDNSGAATPNPDESGTSTDGESTPAVSTPGSIQQPNLAQASRNLSKLVLERNMRSNGFSTAPNATYTNIESAPSLAHPKHYCDITGLSAPYTDPKTRLRYHDKEIFGVIRSLGQGVAEQYLEARGAHTILK